MGMAGPDFGDRLDARTKESNVVRCGAKSMKLCHSAKAFWAGGWNVLFHPEKLAVAAGCQGRPPTQVT